MDKAAYKRLQRKWDRQLRAGGFKDIEYRSTGSLKWWAHRIQDDGATTNNATVRNAQAEYFRRAGQFLHDAVFVTELERRLWELHSEGLSCRAIGRLLSVSKDSVNRMVRRLQARMLR
jgi:DNA-binding NarL/FixJ family response regulator